MCYKPSATSVSQQWLLRRASTAAAHERRRLFRPVSASPDSVVSESILHAHKQWGKLTCGAVAPALDPAVAVMILAPPPLIPLAVPVYAPRFALRICGLM